MATSRKITKKIIPQDSVKEEKSPERVAERSGVQEDAGSKPGRSKRECLFCQKKSHPSYTDLVNLRRHLTDRAKIVSKQRSGVCSRHQRAVAKNIKYARHLALLPFVPKV